MSCFPFYETSPLRQFFLLRSNLHYMKFIFRICEELAEIFYLVLSALAFAKAAAIAAFLGSITLG